MTQVRYMQLWGAVMGQSQCMMPLGGALWPRYRATGARAKRRRTGGALEDDRSPPHCPRLTCKDYCSGVFKSHESSKCLCRALVSLGWLPEQQGDSSQHRLLACTSDGAVTIHNSSQAEGEAVTWSSGASWAVPKPVQCMVRGVLGQQHSCCLR